MKKKFLYMILMLAAMLMLVVGMTGCAQAESLFGRSGTESSETEELEEITDPDLFARDTFMGDIDISGMTLKEAKNACRDAILAEYKDVKVTLKIGDKNMDISAEDINIADTLNFR